MVKRMLVEATHPEETRVAVVSGNKLEELDFEIASRRQLKGNIYLAKVTRVEPSLQAAFVEYGGNRHGFLAFSEIHPDYYRIPVADREALLAAERAEAERAAREQEEADEADSGYATAYTAADPENGSDDVSLPAKYRAEERSEAPEGAYGENGNGDDPAGVAVAPSAESAELLSEARGGAEIESVNDTDETVEELGGDEPAEAVEERRRPRPIRSYKIQEVIKRRQILLVQVVKEERGNKGAALTTFLSLPGRYCVLMPNTGRGGGISRKITNPQDRKRLKEILSDLDVPEGMAVILRTAGLERSKPEIKRDLEYLLRLWDSIREQTLRSTAPALIYEEANLIKRAIRDLYSNDIDEIHVEGEMGYRMAKDFMRMIMPSHAKKVQPYQDEAIPLFFRYQVESQIDAIHNPVVQLRSGGYLVINQTEALVAIDVNSGRSTKERNIEETALRTNLEAAEEVARQLRLRDLAGLIVIDFIDMEDPKNNAAVERRLKEAMKTDRARIQLGRISPFGLLELSRQRLRPSLIETNFEKCPTCQGTGLIRSIESASLYVLRAIEEEGIRRRSSEITVHTATQIALYILNQKRDALASMERRYGFRVFLFGDDSLNPPEYRLERIKARSATEEFQPSISPERILAETDRILELEAVQAEAAEAEAEAEAEDDETEDEEREEQPSMGAEGAEERAERRRRRRRRRGRREDARPELRPEAEAEAAAAVEAVETEAEAEPEEDEEDEQPLAANNAEGDEHPRKKRRRGKRGGRRRSRGRSEFELDADEQAGAEPSEPGEAAPPRPVPAAPEAAPQPVLVSNFADELGDVFGDLDETASEPMEPVPATGPMPVPEDEPRAEQPQPEAQAPEAQPAEEQPAAAPEEAPAKKPRKKAAAAAPRKKAAAAPATRSRKKKAEPAEAPAEAAAEPAPAVSEAVAPEAETAPAPAEAEATPTAEEAPAKKPRKKAAAAPRKKAATTTATRSRKKKAEPAEAQAETVAEPAPAEPKTEAASPDTGEAKPSAEETAEAGPQSSTSYEVIQETPTSNKPKRGWWRRA